MELCDGGTCGLSGTGNSTGQGTEVGIIRVPVTEERAFSLVGLEAAQRMEAGQVVVKLRWKLDMRPRRTEADVLTSGFSIC